MSVLPLMSPHRPCAFHAAGTTYLSNDREQELISPTACADAAPPLHACGLSQSSQSFHGIRAFYHHAHFADEETENQSGYGVAQSHGLITYAYFLLNE